MQMGKASAGFTALLMMLVGLAGCIGGDGGARDTDDGALRVRGGQAPPVVPGEYKMDGDFAQVLAEGPFEALRLETTFIPSPVDGVDIQVAVWRPDVPEGTKVPVIVDAGPYYSGDMTSAYGGHILRLGENFIQHGYAVGALAVRGTANSGGCMDLMGPLERADLDAGVTWFGTQSWSNGNVALIGASYDGSTPFEVASMGNPHLKTIVPVSGLTDIYGLMYRNGTTESRGPVVLNALYTIFSMGQYTSTSRNPDKMATGAVCPASWEGLGWSAYSGAGLGRDPNGWWDARDSRPGMEANYEGSILHIQGLQDWNVDPGLQIPWLSDFAKRNNVTMHQWLGQWGHAFPDSSCHTNTQQNNPNAYRNCRWDYAQYLLHWFDYWLKEETTVDLGPAVQVQEHDRRWRMEDDWPPRDASKVPFELSMPSQLVELGAGVAGEIRLQPNPLGQEEDARSTIPMQGYAEFTTGILDEDVLIAGLPKVHVTVVPDGPGGTLAAWLYKKTPQGLERIGWTALNLLYADGTEEQKPVTPGVPIVARMEIQPMDARVLAGNELVLRIWGYPPSDRVANAAGATINLVVGDEKSILELPIVERDPDAYFEVPFPPGESS